MFLTPLIWVNYFQIFLVSRTTFCCFIQFCLSIKIKGLNIQLTLCSAIFSFPNCSPIAVKSVLWECLTLLIFRAPVKNVFFRTLQWSLKAYLRVETFSLLRIIAECNGERIPAGKSANSACRGMFLLPRVRSSYADDEQSGEFIKVANVMIFFLLFLFLNILYLTFHSCNRNIRKDLSRITLVDYK